MGFKFAKGFTISIDQVGEISAQKIIYHSYHPIGIMPSKTLNIMLEY
jgi:hypothetical protein